MKTRRLQLSNSAPLDLALCIVAILALTLICGCAPKSPDQLLKSVVDAEQAVHKHHLAKDAEAAQNSGRKAWDLASKLDSLARHKTNDVALAEIAGKAMTHARAARNEAELAMNEYEYSKAMNSLFARSYGKARGVVTRGVLNSLADAADWAATNPGSVPNAAPVKRELLNTAQTLVALVNSGNDPSKTNDWKIISSELRSYAASQPPAISLALACGYLSLGQANLALAEMESVSKQSLRTTNDLMFYHGGRCLIYLSRGWNRLAEPEFSALVADLSNGGTMDPRAAGSLYHAFLAVEAGSRRDLSLLDSEIAEAVRAWPENPWLSFLTGEQLAANGRWEEAAQCLEKDAKGTKHEWAAKRMAQRARDLRDGKGSAKSVLLDAGFLTGFALDWATTAGKDTAAGQWIIQAVGSGKSMAESACSDLKSKLHLN